NLLPLLHDNIKAAIQEQLSSGLNNEVFAELVIRLVNASTTNSAQGQQQIEQATGLEDTQQFVNTTIDKSSSSIRVASDKLDDLMNLVSELVANQERLSLLAELSTLPELSAVAEEIEKITRQLRDKTFDICLVPIGSLLTRF